MGWDFSTDPEFQIRLDWVDAFVRDEIEPIDVLFARQSRVAQRDSRSLVVGLPGVRMPGS